MIVLDREAGGERPGGEDAELLEVGRRLARLPALLGPVEPALEERVMRRVRAATQRRRPALRPSWAVAGLTAVLLLILMLTPMGQTAVASFLAVFHLGRTEVQIVQTETPAPSNQQPAVRQQLTLAQARDLLPFAIPQPAYLPPGYRLQEVGSYTYPDLPEWVPQPILVDLVYGNGAGQSCTLRIYPIMLGEEASISGVNLAATSVEKVQDLEINGQPGVLLRVGSAWQEVVWEQGDLVLALWAPDLPEEELLRIARSVVGQ